MSRYDDDLKEFDETDAYTEEYSSRDYYEEDDGEEVDLDDYGEEEDYSTFVQDREEDADMGDVSGSYIDSGAEWRDFADGGPTKSRVGMARRADLTDEDLGTVIFDDRFKKLERISRTPEDVFRLGVYDAVKRYNLSSDLASDALKLAEYMRTYNRGLRYRNPRLVVLALSVITGGKIDIKGLPGVVKTGGEDGVTDFDIIRYASFILDLRSIALKK